MIAGQLAVILVVRFAMHLDVPLAALLSIVGLEAVLNVFAGIAGRRTEVRDWWLAAIMAFDVVMCTGLLYLTGGPANPFSFLYLVQIALAAVMLRSGWTWALVGLALLASAVLFLWHRPLPANLTHDAYMELHLRGMWVAFGIAAGFIVYFLMRVRGALETREAELATSRRATARQERLASLATLAAGAAHELSTPLGTIAVVVKELEHLLATPAGGNDTAKRDIRLIREQVDRCRDILERMSSEAGQSVGEAFASSPIVAVVDAALLGLPGRVPVRTEIAVAGRDLRLRLPPRAFSQALRGLLKNAQEASPADAEVALHVAPDPRTGGLRIEVSDHGPGIPPDILERIGEPFFTTKPTGRGMGLGVFLARAVVERLGGRVDLASTVGGGTKAIVQLPHALVQTPALDEGAAPA